MSALALARDTDLGALVLDLVQKQVDVPGIRVDARIVDGTVDRTIEAASTLTLVLEDGRRDLLRSGVFSQQIDVQLDGQWWRLVQVSKGGANLTLTFEDRVVSLLRQNTTPRKAARSSMTRAEFALSLVNELKPPPPFVCPDLTVVQKVAATKQQAPIGDSTQQVTDAQRAATMGQGLAAGAKLTIKGAPANAEQLANAQRVLDVAHSLNAPDRVCVALLEACTVESLFTNPTTPSADGYGSRGILQVRDSTGASMGITNTDVEQCVNAFLTRGFTGAGGAITYAAKNPQLTTGQIAQAMEGSAYPGRYDMWQKEAVAMLAAYKGEPPGAQQATFSTTAATKAAPYYFQRGGTDGSKQSSWDCLQSLAGDVQWRCFVVDGRVYFVSEVTMLQQKPQLVVSEDVLGVDGIDFDVDNGKDDSEATLTVRASRWGITPGSVIELYDCGPADGRWIVRDVSRGLFDAEATVSLKRVTLPLLEPAADPSSAAADPNQPFGVTPGLATTGGSPLARAYAAAQALTAKQYPYIWGGGHAHAGTPDNPRMVDPQHGTVDAGIGFDCSGLQAAMLAAAGMGFQLGDPVPGSGTFASSWGEAGEGVNFTLWASADHVWSAFKEPGKGWHHFGTGDWGSGNEYLGFKPEMHPTAGFTPRHWKGT